MLSMKKFNIIRLIPYKLLSCLLILCFFATNLSHADTLRQAREAMLGQVEEALAQEAIIATLAQASEIGSKLSTLGHDIRSCIPTVQGFAPLLMENLEPCNQPELISTIARIQAVSLEHAKGVENITNTFATKQEVQDLDLANRMISEAPTAIAALLIPDSVLDIAMAIELPDHPDLKREDAEEALGYIRQGLLVFNRLLHDFLDEVREPVSLNINDIVQSDTTHAIGHDRVAVTYDLATQLPHILAFPGDVTAIYSNLIKNAIEAIQDKGEVSVRTWVEDGMVCLSIADTGSGIAPGDIPEIFDKGKTMGREEGTGLGLHIAKSNVERYKGTIEVASLAACNQEIWSLARYTATEETREFYDHFLPILREYRRLISDLIDELEASDVVNWDKIDSSIAAATTLVDSMREWQETVEEPSEYFIRQFFINGGVGQSTMGGVNMVLGPASMARSIDEKDIYNLRFSIAMLDGSIELLRRHIEGFDTASGATFTIRLPIAPEAPHRKEVDDLSLPRPAQEDEPDPAQDRAHHTGA